MNIRPARWPSDTGEVRRLFREYADGLGVDLCFQGFDEELARLPGAYRPPKGALLMAEVEGHPVGVVALRPSGPPEDGACEMKRLYVEPAHRGGGLGRRLAEAIVDHARWLGYRTMVLDTLDTLAPALHLYRAMGFQDAEPYYENPLPDVVYLRRDLA